MAVVSASGAFRRPAAVTKPERSEWTAKSPSMLANARRIFTMSRTAAGLSASSIWPRLRILRKKAPETEFSDVQYTAHPEQSGHNDCMSTLHEIGDAVRTRRTEMGLTQEALARISGLSRSTINAVEARSIANLSISKAEGLLESLGLAMNVSTSIARGPANKLPPPRTALQRAAATASVSYKPELTARQLSTSLLHEKIPFNLRPHVRALLDEAPVSLLAKVVQELAMKNGIQPAKLWANMRSLAKALQCYRGIWR